MIVYAPNFSDSFLVSVSVSLLIFVMIGWRKGYQICICFTNIVLIEINAKRPSHNAHSQVGTCSLLLLLMAHYFILYIRRAAQTVILASQRSHFCCINNGCFATLCNNLNGLTSSINLLPNILIYIRSCAHRVHITNVYQITLQSI